MYLNKAFIIGNLTRDPELKNLPSGSAVSNFSVATNRRYKGQDGNWQEATDYHNIVVFGRQAETVSQYLSKGSMCLIEGRIQTRSWEKDGQKQYRTEVVADRIQFGPRGGNGGGGGNDEGGKVSGADKNDPASGGINYPEEDINPEDIPF